MIPPPIKCDALINLPGIHQVGVFAQDVVTFHRNCRFPELGYLLNMAERAPDSKKNNELIIIAKYIWSAGGAK